MCYEIDSDVIMANLLRNKDNCSIKELVHIKQKIEEENPDVYVDVTRNSIFSAIETNPLFFIWVDDQIKRSNSFDQQFVELFFNESYSSKLKKIIQSTIGDK